VSFEAAKPADDNNTTPIRLEVNIGAMTEDALIQVIAHDGVTTTEALRRLVGLGHIWHCAVHFEDAEIWIRRPRHGLRWWQVWKQRHVWQRVRLTSES
jgi:hypothetical protein